jgi:hypothetical protein
MSWKWNVWNTEPTVPSTGKNKFIHDMVRVGLTHKAYYFEVYDTPLGHRWLDALKDNLRHKRILEKNFCFLGFADSKRDLRYLVGELNSNIAKINAFAFEPAYEKIHAFSTDDFQFSSALPIGKAVNGDESATPGKRLKHEACNLLHRYFEELQGTAWQLSDFYKQADPETKYAIRQLNNICHEIEGWVMADRDKVVDPEWMRPSQITTFLNAPRYDLHGEDFELFKQNRYDRELGGVYLHWSQVGKTLYEVFRDEHAPKMTASMCTQINHQKYYSGEFDVEWGQTITEDGHDFKKKEMDDYRQWLDANGYDWEDPQLSLGYIKIGQVDIQRTFGTDASIQDIHNVMNDNLNITSIRTITGPSVECDYPYTLDDADWKQIQMEGLKRGYESRSVR